MRYLPRKAAADSAQLSISHLCPTIPARKLCPSRNPSRIPPTGVPVRWKADRETWAGHTATLYGVEDFHYRDYVLRADKVVYNQETSELEAEGHLQVTGGPADIVSTLRAATCA